MAVVEKMTLTFMETLLNESMSNALWEQLARTEANGCWPRSTVMVFTKQCVFPPFSPGGSEDKGQCARFIMRTKLELRGLFN